MEELWSKGEAGVDFDNLSRILEPDHFQCMFLIMGCIFSVQLIVLLWDILSNPSFGFVKLMLAGMFACLLFTFVNLFFFSTFLLTPIIYDTPERRITTITSHNYNKIATPARTISTGDFEYNIEMLVNNKLVAFAILGFGAVTSFIFIFLAMIRSLGISHFFSTINILLSI